MTESVRIYVQSDRVPGAIAVVDLAQELEGEWSVFCDAVRRRIVDDLHRSPSDRETLAYLCRTIAERIKWVTQSVLSADPACQDLNDVIRRAADSARADVIAELEAMLDQDRTFLDEQDLAELRARHALPPATG